MRLRKIVDLIDEQNLSLINKSMHEHTYKYRNFRRRLWVTKKRKSCVMGSITGIRWTLFSINVRIAVYKLKWNEWENHCWLNGLCTYPVDLIEWFWYATTDHNFHSSFSAIPVSILILMMSLESRYCSKKEIIILHRAGKSREENLQNHVECFFSLFRLSYFFEQRKITTF